MGTSLEKTTTIMNSKVFFVVLAALFAVAVAYSSVTTKVCFQPGCSGALCQTLNVPTNDCEPNKANPGTYAIINCTSDGSSVNIFGFDSSDCSTAVQSATEPTGSCVNFEGAYAEFTCN